MLRNENKAATFLAPTSLERDALVHGFQSLLAIEFPETGTCMNSGESKGDRDTDESRGDYKDSWGESKACRAEMRESK